MNYGRFFTLLKRVPNAEDAKCDFVSQFTGGRTTSLKEMTPKEYDTMCEVLEARLNWTLKKRRSTALKLMQELGIDTTSWKHVDAFCLAPRIAGRKFSQLNSDELAALATKLRMIKRKGGLEKSKQKQTTGECHFLMINNKNIES